MELYEAADKYRAYQRDTLERADNTVTGIMQEVLRLSAWLADQDLIDTTEINADLIEAFIHASYITNATKAKAAGRKPLAETTVNLYKSRLRAYLQWLAIESLLGADSAPWRKVVLKSKPKAPRKKKFAHREDIHHYAAQARKIHPRNEAWIYFQHYMARRRGELQHMRVADIDLEPSPDYPFGLFVFDNTKSRRGSVRKPIEPAFAPIAKRWLEEYAELLGRKLRPTDYLIPALTPGKGWTRPGVRRLMVICPDRFVDRSTVRKLLTEVGVPNSHALRRGAAVSIAKRHGIRAAKTMLDQADERTTEIYMDRDRESVELGAMFAGEAANSESAGMSLEPPEQTPAPVPADMLAARRQRRLRPA